MVGGGGGLAPMGVWGRMTCPMYGTEVLGQYKTLDVLESIRARRDSLASNVEEINEHSWRT